MGALSTLFKYEWKSFVRALNSSQSAGKGGGIALLVIGIIMFPLILVGTYFLGVATAAGEFLTIETARDYVGPFLASALFMFWLFWIYLSSTISLSMNVGREKMLHYLEMPAAAWRPFFAKLTVESFFNGNIALAFFVPAVGGFAAGAFGVSQGILSGVMAYVVVALMMSTSTIVGNLLGLLIILRAKSPKKILGIMALIGFGLFMVLYFGIIFGTFSSIDEEGPNIPGFQLDSILSLAPSGPLEYVLPSSYAARALVGWMFADPTSGSLNTVVLLAVVVVGFYVVSRISAYALYVGSRYSEKKAEGKAFDVAEAGESDLTVKLLSKKDWSTWKRTPELLVNLVAPAILIVIFVGISLKFLAEGLAGLAFMGSLMSVMILLMIPLTSAGYNIVMEKSAFLVIKMSPVTPTDYLKSKWIPTFKLGLIYFIPFVVVNVVFGYNKYYEIPALLVSGFACLFFNTAATCYFTLKSGNFKGLNPKESIPAGVQLLYMLVAGLVNAVPNVILGVSSVGELISPGLISGSEWIWMSVGLLWSVGTSVGIYYAGKAVFRASEETFMEISCLRYL